MFEHDTGHPSLDEAGADSVDTNVGMAQLIGGSLSNAVDAIYWEEMSVQVESESSNTYADLLALSVRVLVGDGRGEIVTNLQSVGPAPERKPATAYCERQRVFA